MKFIENTEGEFLNLDYIVKIYCTSSLLEGKTIVYEIICELTDLSKDVLGLYFSEDKRDDAFLELLEKINNRNY